MQLENAEHSVHPTLVEHQDYSGGTAASRRARF